MNKKKEIFPITLDEHKLGEHFYDQHDCGEFGPVTSILLEQQGGRRYDNVHKQILSILRNTTLEDLIVAYRQVHEGHGVIHQIKLKKWEDYRYFYANDESVPLICFRKVVKGSAGSCNCCNMIEELFCEKVIPYLKDQIINGRGYHLEEMAGMKCWNNWEGRMFYPKHINVDAIIGSPRVRLICRESDQMNNWWNFKETVDNLVMWKYRFACNLVVEMPGARHGNPEIDDNF